jgi:hypothetical protein
MFRLFYQLTFSRSDVLKKEMQIKPTLEKSKMVPLWVLLARNKIGNNHVLMRLVKNIRVAGPDSAWDFPTPP